MDEGIGTILLVEDDEIDTELALKVIKTTSPSMKVVTVSNGAEALKFLVPPAASLLHLLNLKMVLLDLHMPGIDGFEVLRRMKSDSVTKHIPVVVFTSSREMKDVETCYRDGANSYIVKPIAMERYEEAVANIIRYWTHFNETLKEYSAPLMAEP
ncbi:MAG: response regulator [Bacteroidota bacterium]